MTLVNMLVIALRYITALGYVPVLVVTFAPVINSGLETCRRMGRLPGIIGVICQGIILAFLILRLFAIYDKKQWILYAALPFGLLNVVLSSLAIGKTDLVSVVDDLLITGNCLERSNAHYFKPRIATTI